VRGGGGGGGGSETVTNGVVTSVDVVSSSGSGALDTYAVGHVRKRWKWPAGTTASYTQPFRFILKQG
jgi:protein TonB